MTDDQQAVSYGRPLLGRILGEKFNLLDSKLDEALAYQREKGGRLGEALLHLRALREEELLEALALQFELEWVPHLETAQIDHELIKKVPISFSRRYRILPIRYEDEAVIVATTDPLETVALDDLRLLLGKPIRPVLTTGLALLACLNRVYDEAASPAGAEQVMEDIAAAENLDQLAHELDEPQDLLDATDEAPIIRLVNSVLFQAVRQRASDIHFESFERGLVVREHEPQCGVLLGLVEVDLGERFRPAVKPGIQAPPVRRIRRPRFRHHQAVGLYAAIDLRHVAPHHQAGLRGPWRDSP